MMSVTIFILGAIIGSFLNVVLYRLHTGRSLGGRSHCLSCGKELSWYELLPVLSYVMQAGKCRLCASYVPSRYLVVELLTGTTFLLVWHIFAYDWVRLVLYLVLASLSILIVVYDVRHTIIPDELTLMVTGIAFFLASYDFYVLPDITHLLLRILAGLCAALFFWGLWYVSKGKWIGFGDAKLAFPLGVIVGIGGVFSMVVLSFWIGAVISLFFLFLQRLVKRGKILLHFPFLPRTMKSEVPFAPFLLAGFMMVQLFHADIFSITYALFFS